MIHISQKSNNPISQLGQVNQDESNVSRILRMLPMDEYIVLDNIMICLDNNTHQIDHVVLSRYGIFVIETKGYNGIIKGEEWDKKWIQFTWNDKKYLINPIVQNYGHIKALSKYLKLPDNKFINIICLATDAKVEVTSSGQLTRLFNINDRIRSYKKVLINTNLFEIRDKLVHASGITYSQYVGHFEKANYKKEQSENKCPKCGGTLVRREGQYGYFVGCSNYPKCTYKRKF